MLQAFTTLNSIDDFALIRLPGLTEGVRGLILPFVNALADKLMADATFAQVFELTPDGVKFSAEHEQRFREWDRLRSKGVA